MADEPALPDDLDELGEGEEAPAPKKKRKIDLRDPLTALLIVNGLAVVGLVTAALLGAFDPPPPIPPPDRVADMAMTEVFVEGQQTSAEYQKAGPVFYMEPMFISLTDPGAERFLKVTLQLELDENLETRVELHQRRPQIDYTINQVLSGKRLAQVKGEKNVEGLRRLIRDRINMMLRKGRVVDVWPEEWIVQ
jgi:flagellar basal body-associated protein FliL